MNIWRFWGKTHGAGALSARITHPLLCHMIDVAEVTGALWDACFGTTWHRELAERLGISEEGCRAVLMFWAGLHDLGKASPAFQRRFEPAISWLQAEGLGFPLQIGQEPCYHGTLSTWALIPLFGDLGGLGAREARGVALAVGGHHGSWPPANSLRGLGASQAGGQAWQQARQQLYEALCEHYRPPTPSHLGIDREERQAFLTWLSGLVSVADWIGSMTEYFAPHPEVDALPPYAQHARLRAACALRIPHTRGGEP